MLAQSKPQQTSLKKRPSSCLGGLSAHDHIWWYFDALTPYRSGGDVACLVFILSLSSLSGLVCGFYACPLFVVTTTAVNNHLKDEYDATLCGLLPIH